jgi:hypothetical protein
VKALIVNLVWKLVLLGAVMLCTAIGWMLYDVARYGRFDSVIAEWFHTVQVTMQVMLRTDPIMTLVFFPFGILVILILFGLLIWLHQER